MATVQICVPISLHDSQRLIDKLSRGAARSCKLTNNSCKPCIHEHAENYVTSKEHKTPNIKEVYGALVSRVCENYISSCPRNTSSPGDLGCSERGAGYKIPRSQAKLPSQKPLIYTGKVIDVECEHALCHSGDLNPHNFSSVGGSLSNIPVKNHRNREAGSEYFDWNELDEFTEANDEDDGAQDEDDDAEIVALWTNVPSNDPPDPPPTRDGVPLVWESHHDFLVWACRGTIVHIRVLIQSMFRFRPPISEEFLLGRLNGRFAAMHLEFLFRFLPGETGTIQQATDRIAMQIRGSIDRDIVEGRQTIQNPPLGYSDPQYRVPPMPGNAPRDWNRDHDVMLSTFVGEHPADFLDDCGDFLEHGACLEFLQVRMAQSIHLGISMEEEQEANSRIRENRMVRDWIA